MFVGNTSIIPTYKIWTRFVGNTVFIPTYGDMKCWEFCFYPNLQ